MKRFYLVKNSGKEGVSELAEMIKSYVASRGGVAADAKEVPRDTEAILVLGGDGTFLAATRDYSKYDLPFHGINMGSLGFLTQTSARDTLSAVDKLMKDEYTIEHRVQLRCVGKNGDGATALNDVVVSRGGFSHLVGITVYVNDQLFSAYEGDGVIISTATGSTGYNLSTGGPIVTPNVNAILITPICPHALNVRSFVISGDDKVRIKIKGTRHRMSEAAYVTVDGVGYSTLLPDEEILIEKSELTCRMILLSSASFIDTLKNKLY